MAYPAATVSCCPSLFSDVNRWQVLRVFKFGRGGGPRAAQSISYRLAAGRTAGVTVLFPPVTSHGCIDPPRDLP
jgi:hypothetical protein